LGDDRWEGVDELFADHAIITLPGARFKSMDAPEEFLELLAPRYEWANDEPSRWITTGLYGVDSDGEEFADIRYVDVYEVRDGLIHRLDIWNDLAAEGVVDPESGP